MNLLLALSLLLSSIDGVWTGQLQAGATPLRVAITIKANGPGLTGTFNSLDQGSGELPLDEVTFADGTLRFKLKIANGSYEGKVAGNTIDGRWSQSGFTAPLMLKRVEAIPVAPRPQMPKKPYPYDEEEIAVDKLAGTLTLPRAKGPHPAVVLISGSGAQDRDETVFEHKPFLVLADDLTRRGIAVMRVDDRGVGKSTGMRETATTEDLAKDVETLVAFLKSRKDIDAKRIGLIGHSEGGLIAPMVATRTKDIAFLVLIGSPAIPGDELINLQVQAILRAMGATPAQLEQTAVVQRKAIALAKTVAGKAELRTKLLEFLPAATVDSQIDTLASPWYRWMLNYDPRPALKKVTVPMLAVNGAKDVQVPAKENLDAIRAAAPKATVVELPGLNHLLQTAKTGLVAEYGQIEETIAPAALKVIGEWVAKTTSSP
jgi:uncharacterized protein